MAPLNVEPATEQYPATAAKEDHGAFDSGTAFA
ncbi:hypothetical protein SAMN04487785_116117 [Dyella jiangningensis]|nr:hypothetical protein BDW41_1144 [Dyella sp. AtDHG13]SDL24754.1 hypothetical protein SAMN04487785_116117 [Dyella jiangningensis]